MVKRNVSFRDESSFLSIAIVKEECKTEPACPSAGFLYNPDTDEGDAVERSLRLACFVFLFLCPVEACYFSVSQDELNGGSYTPYIRKIKKGC